MIDQAAPVARLIFTGERFVSLPKLAALLNDAIDPNRPMRFEEVTLTHLRLSGDRLSLRLDLDFENGGPEVSLTILRGADDPEGLLAALTYALVSRVAVRQIVWPGSSLRIPRDQFLESLADILGAPRKEFGILAPRPNDRRPAARPRPSRRAATDPHDRIDRYADAMGSVRASDRRYDAHVMAFEAAMRDSLRAEPSHQPAPEIAALPVEARLATWAMSLSAATIALPVAIPIIAWNLVKGEDMRAATLSVGLAGFVFALDHSGAMAAAF